MNKELQALIDRQKKIMFEWECWQDIQTEHNTNEEIYRLCQWAMDTLNDMCERIRYIIEKGVSQ